MVSWKHISEDEAKSNWDDWLIALDNYSVFQSFAWGEYKRCTGWHVDRWVAEDDKTPLAAAQALSKRLPGGIRLIWIPGGPLVRKIYFENGKVVPFLKRLIQALSEQFGSKIYVRLNMSIPTSVELTYQLSRCFKRVIWPISASYSYHLQIQPKEDDMLACMRKKHRYYTRKSLSAPIVWKEGTGEEYCRDFLNVHDQMIRSKGLERLAVPHDDFRLLLQSFSKQARIVTGYVETIPVTTCLILILGQSGFYYLAATNDKGRELSASYGMAFRAMLILLEKGITHLDMGGIDPRKDQGVTHFKKGFGGRMVEYLGEWDWASSEWLRCAANIMIACKKRSV